MRGKFHIVLRPSVASFGGMPSRLVLLRRPSSPKPRGTPTCWRWIHSTPGTALRRTKVIQHLNIVEPSRSSELCLFTGAASDEFERCWDWILYRPNSLRSALKRQQWKQPVLTLSDETN